mgnify:CR=1 FL=1
MSLEHEESPIRSPCRSTIILLARMDLKHILVELVVVVVAVRLFGRGGKDGASFALCGHTLCLWRWSTWRPPRDTSCWCVRGVSVAVGAVARCRALPRAAPRTLYNMLVGTFSHPGKIWSVALVRASGILSPFLSASRSGRVRLGPPLSWSD